MIGVALQTLRARWVSFLGTVVALVLGVAQVASMGLLLMGMFDLPQRPVQRFATAPAVVQPNDPTWNASEHDVGARSLAQAEGVSAALLAKVSATGPTVVDRSFYAQPAGGPATSVGHPWAVAGYGGYHLVSGRSPAGAGEVAVGVGQGRVGQKLTVLTAAGPAVFTVSGTVSAVSWEHAVFFSDAEAAALSPRIDDLVALGPLDAVRAAVAGSQAEVLTGQDRHKADPSATTDRRSLDDTITLVPVMAGVAGVTAVFVVASTFGFAVIQRRREVALLRAVGATPQQVRKMVRGEALLVGAFASAVGTALGLLGAQWLAQLLIGMGIAPSWFTVAISLKWTVLAPLAAAFLVGVGVALGGAVTAAGRAGRIRPIEALREAAVDEAGWTPGRRLLGLLGLVGGVAWAAWIGIASPNSVLSPNTYVMSLTVPVLAAAVLAPFAVGPLTRLLMRPFRRSSGATAMLVREGALTSRRRIAATAAPVLLTVGLAFSLMAATSSLGAARDSGAQNQVSAPYALVPDGTPGISPQVVARVAAIHGVRVAAPLATTIYTPSDGNTDQNDALVVDPAALRDTMKLQVVAGSLDALNDTSMAVADIWDWPVGSEVPVHLPDGQVATLRVAATYRAVRGQDVAYLPMRFAASAAYAKDGLVPDAYVSLAPGTDPAAAAKAIRAAVAGGGASFVSRDRLVSSESSYSTHLIKVRQQSTALIIVLFCFIAILNTLLMATADRRRDLAVLRLAGATPRQVLKFFVGESLLVVAIGTVLALAATAVNLAGLWGALLQLFGSTPIEAPYSVILGITAVSLLLALVGTVLPVGAALRGRSLGFVGTGE